MAGNVKEEHYKIVYDTGGVIKPKGDEQEETRNNQLRKPAPASMYKKGGEIEDIDKKIAELKAKKDEQVEAERIANFSDSEREVHENRLNKDKDVTTYRDSRTYKKEGFGEKKEVDKNIDFRNLSWKEKRKLREKNPNMKYVHHTTGEDEDMAWSPEHRDEFYTQRGDIVTTDEDGRKKILSEKDFKYKKGWKDNIRGLESTVYKDSKEGRDELISKLISEKTSGKDIRVTYQDQYKRGVDPKLKETDPEEYERQLAIAEKYRKEHPMHVKESQEELTSRDRHFGGILDISSHRKVFSKKNTKTGEMEYYQDWDFDSMPKRLVKKIADFFGNYDFLEDEPRKISEKRFKKISKLMGKRHSRLVTKTDREGAPENRTGKTKVRESDGATLYEVIDKDGKKSWSSGEWLDYEDRGEKSPVKGKDTDEDERIKRHTVRKRAGGQIGYSYKNQKYQKPTGNNYASSNRASQGETFSDDITGMGE